MNELNRIVETKTNMMELIKRIRRLLKPIKNHLVDRWWQVRGPAFRNPPLPTVVSSIVFVCKGNICRSAFAQYLALQLLRKNGEPRPLRIASAGIAAHTGTMSPTMAIKAARAFGIDMKPHIAQLLTDDMVEAADMLIAMEPGQVLAMQKQYPQKKRHVFLLPLFADGWDLNYFGWMRYHIQDPYGKGQDEFQESFSRVGKSVDGLMKKLIR